MFAFVFTLQDGFDCLHLAAANGHHKVVKLLLSHGADMATRNTVSCFIRIYLFCTFVKYVKLQQCCL